MQKEGFMFLRRSIFIFCCTSLSLVHAVDRATEIYYEQGKEKDRLQSLQLEKDRTVRILSKMLPPAPRVILDVGGAAGVYAIPLAQAGYEVHLSDPIPLHIEQAQEYARNSATELASCRVGDARKIDRPDNSADIVLFFGPLYHLTDPIDRMQALSEAHRVLKPGGRIFVVGISRFASLMNYIYLGRISEKSERIEQDISKGLHTKTTFTAYLHHPAELREEVVKAGFTDVSLHAIEGPVWDKDKMDILQKNPADWEELLNILEKIESDESIIGASAHIMAIGKKNEI